MRKYIGRLYVDYFFFNIWAISLTFVVLDSVIFKFTFFEEVFCIDVYIFLLLILVIVFFNHFIVIMIRHKYEYNTFFEITDEHFKLSSTSVYTFFKLEKVAPLRNILDYTIKQNILSKKFNIYKVSINTGSEKLGFYVSRKDVEQLEKQLLVILENNLNYRRYKDE